MKTKERIDYFGEVFTPKNLVNEIINKIPLEHWANSSYSVLDPACGNGQFIIETLNKKVAAGLTKDEALKETYAVDLMASNIADVIARIVFWKTWNIDIFDEQGKPIDNLKLDGYADDDTAYWLKDYVASGKAYKRVYTLGELCVSVRTHPEKWWQMEFYIKGSDDKCYTGNGFCKNFVVADGLKYDFEFSGTEPRLKTDKEILLENIEKEIKLKDLQLKELCGM